jgi:hypothetical protein
MNLYTFSIHPLSWVPILLVQYMDLNSPESVLYRATLALVYLLLHSLLESSNKGIFSVDLTLVSIQFDVIFSSREVNFSEDRPQLSL